MRTTGECMSRYYKEDYTPWSFVLPMALAVMLGVLAADAVRLALAAMFVKSAVEQINDQLKKQTTPGHLPARPNATQAEPELEVEYLPGAFDPQLPGLLEANRKRLDRACIGGTISVRESNGWSQELSGSYPQKCVATTR